MTKEDEEVMWRLYTALQAYLERVQAILGTKKKGQSRTFKDQKDLGEYDWGLVECVYRYSGGGRARPHKGGMELIAHLERMMPDLKTHTRIHGVKVPNEIAVLYGNVNFDNVMAFARACRAAGLDYEQITTLLRAAEQVED